MNYRSFSGNAQNKEHIPQATDDICNFQTDFPEPSTINNPSPRRHVLIDIKRDHWFKGNVHAHSTISDGKLSPEEVAELYKKHGYSFLAFSEHQCHTYHANLEDPSFIILPAIERNKSFGNPKRYFHVNGILGPKYLTDAAIRPPYNHMEYVPMPNLDDYPKAAQKSIDELLEAGYMVMFNHPNWSFNCFNDLLSVNGYFAVEILNYTSQVESGIGFSTVYWDALLRSGRKVWGIAADDNHNGNKFGEAPPDWDSFGGWVMVNATELSHEAITSALLNGKFYSTMGPEIYHLAYDGKNVYVECSPVQTIRFISYFPHGYCRRDRHGKNIESAEYELRSTEKYVRVECVDEMGRIAWSNPIFLDTPFNPALI